MMRKRTVSSIVAAASLLILVVAFHAWADDWMLLGSRTVALIGERDEILVTADMGTFKAIQIRVIDTGVEFDRLVIVFRNGRTIEAPIREFIPAGGSTRVIDLPGRNRIITKIIMHYKTRPGTLDRAQVEAWGLRN